MKTVVSYNHIIDWSREIVDLTDSRLAFAVGKFRLTLTWAVCMLVKY